MAITQWNPFRDLEVFQSRMNRVFDEALRGGPGGRSGEHWAPPLEVYERENDLVVEADLPGIEAKDVDVRVDNNVLTIRGERKLENEANRGQIHHREVIYGQFVRSLSLPMTIDQEHIQAELKDGVLRLRLPKSEKARARQIQIQGAGQQQLPPQTQARATEGRTPELAGVGSSEKNRR